MSGGVRVTRVDVNGEAHRLFVWSADLFAESLDMPWVKGAVVSPLMKPVLEFIVAQQGPVDTHLVCDGRCRQVRKLMEEIMENDRHLSELWAVYGRTERLGRRVSYACENREAMLLSSCLPRTSIPAKDRRGAYAGAGEDSTHASSYTNIPPVPWGALPQIKLEDKMRIVGGPVDALAAPQGRNLYDSSRGVPLFWSERKPVAFWSQLISDLDIKCILDLSPGSGSLARAALADGVQYVGVVRNPEHASWLQNVLDRYALELVTKSGTPLFEQDLATCIAEHFQEVLDQLQEAAAMQDTVPDVHDDG